ncbi:metallophosphoesterase [Sporosarcina sp. ACRSL]|uniref:metallophosphoesterase n=1 Tax=Sporosarcina sp. ACRSL TaxID=2918215 RepID=UPI001EF4BF67|nr:metallophosphoesterase [Sporosarcina sp. ACRSL]MCG7344764.1 metallophosphoesterase [Sporosarcina sp. ACRSL]
MSIVLGVVFLIIYVSFAYYIGYNLFVWLRETFSFKRKKTVILFAILLAAAYPIGVAISFVPLEVIGGYWLVVIGYGVLVFPLVNIIYFLRKRTGIKLLGYLAVSFYASIFIIGTLNAWSPVIKSYDITIQKETERGNLKILMASDFHLNNIIKNNHLQRFLQLSKEINPDIILLPGDIIDNSVAPYLRHQLGDIMKEIKAPMGVYATMGNHENYGRDIPIIIEEFKQAGITVLEDEARLINDEFYLVGRKDFQDSDRVSLQQLTKDIDKEKPIFMLDHQPVELDIAVQNGIDLMVSGHTHRGQLYPGHLITERIYENAYGHLHKNGMHSIVSSGFGLWGPPLRIGSRAEVVVINVHFEE